MNRFSKISQRWLGAALLVVASISLASQNFSVLQEIKRYASFEVMGLNATKNLVNFHSQTGVRVLERDGAGHATKVRVRALSDNAGNDVRVYGDFNNWDRKTAVQLQKEDGGTYFSAEVSGLTHGSQYRFILNGSDVIDPSADMYSTSEINRRMGRAGDSMGRAADNLNSEFWDIEGEGHPKYLANPPDLRGRAVVLGEQELYELVKKWSYKGQTGPKDVTDTYNFVRESGIISFLKDQGYNAFEFLPFNQSMDGSNWSYRYQVYGLFAPNSRYGTPAEFGEMISQFNEQGILVIMDTVIGHYPFQGNTGIRSLSPIGMQNWKKSNGQNLYGQEMSPWNTYRYDYQNPFVRQFLVDSVLTMLKNYGIGGIRFDNYDGIRFLAGGETFLKELAGRVREYRPETLLIAEMFFGENKVTEGLGSGGYGINARTHKDFFDFIKDNAKKRTEEINMDVLKTAVRGPWSWGEAARVSYITNHDEAANGRDGATGAYFGSLVDGGGNFYVFNKTKAYASLAMLSGSFYMDMPQLRIAQRGTFSSNSPTDWSLLKNDDEGKLNRYFGALTNYFVGEPAFAFQNQDSNIENHTDFENKVISLQRTDQTTGKHIIVVVNLSHKGLDNYRFGVNLEGQLRLVINSDAPDFGGNGDVGRTLPQNSILTSEEGMHGKTHSLKIPYLPPYGILVFER